MKRARGGGPLAAGLVFCALVSGCYAHERQDGGDDGGSDAALVPDAFVLDAGLDGDVGPAIDAASCQRIDGFRRCDFACPAPCSSADGRCDMLAQVCRRDLTEQGFGCDCTGSWLCATNTDRPVAADAGPFTPPFEGTCMPVGFCRDAPAAGMHVACVYSDGTPFVHGPASGTCGASVPSMPSCGGACGDTPCAMGSCIGVSEDRAYGLCSLVSGFCREESGGGPGGNGLILASCSDAYGGEPCVCLVPSPQDLDATHLHERGWAVPASACQAYATANPGHARCVDGGWNAI